MKVSNHNFPKKHKQKLNGDLVKMGFGKQKHILLFFYHNTQQAIIEKHSQIIKFMMITDDERLQTSRKSKITFSG